MRYKGRSIDAVAFWNQYVQFPSGTRSDESFLPKVPCPNPGHDTVKRHFQVNAQEPYVHCFAACGISGSWEHAICMIEGLYDRRGVDLEICRRAWDTKPAKRTAEQRDQIRRYFRAHKDASRVILGAAGKLVAGKPPVKKGSPGAATVVPASDLEYDSFLPAVAIEYLAARGITEHGIAKWRLGWLREEKRIAIPALDESDRLKFLIKRAVLPSQNPKYLYTEGFPKTSLLFGACAIDPGMVSSTGLGLVEGSIDTIVIHQHGLRNFCGILGTGISDKQCQIIARRRPKRVYLWFDKDSAGVLNLEIAAGKLRKYPLYVVRYPKGKSDPAETTEKEAWRQISRAVPISKFITSNGLSVRSRKGS